MEKIRIDVVGLYHWDVQDHWKEYATEAVGKHLVLQPQPENMKDPYAVRAREGSLHVGFVAVTDLDAVYQALAGSGRKYLRGVVVESNPEPPVLTVEVEVDKIDWSIEPYDDSIYDGWHYDGLMLMPKKLEQLGDLALDLTDELETSVANRDGGLEGSIANRDGASADGVTNRDGITGKGVANRDSLLKMVRQLLATNLYDPSREMTRARYRIERLLAQHSDPELQKAARQLRQQKGLLMRHVNRDRMARYLFLDWPAQLRKKGLEASHYTYDNRLDELRSQLQAFPYQLYDKFMSDPVDFLRELYYKHVPRRHLFALLSGIVLMIMKGRVEIQRWGREGDTEPIDRIRNFNRQPAESDREGALKQGLHELLQQKDVAGKPVITQKNQWAALIGILSFDYHVPSSDLRDMCRKMTEWGFGPDSGYDCYCDYGSVSKSSDYANNAFSDWRGSGAAHKRQVAAALALREILRAKIGYR